MKVSQYITDLRAIEVPADWNADKDLEMYHAKLGYPRSSYFDDLYECFYQVYRRKFQANIEYALEVLPACETAYPYCLVMGQGVEQQLSLFEDRVNALESRAVQDQLLEAVEVCQWVQREYQRVLREANKKGAEGWYYPVIAVMEYVERAASLLEKAVREYRMSQFE